MKVQFNRGQEYSDSWTRLLKAPSNGIQIHSTAYKIHGIGLELPNVQSSNSCQYSSWCSVGLWTGSVIGCLVGYNEPGWGRTPKGDSRTSEEVELHKST